MEINKRAQMFWIWLIFGVIIVVVGLAIFFSFYTPNSTTGASSSPSSGSLTVGNNGQIYQVMISNYAFNPSSLSVGLGDTVVWTNQDSVSHTITSDTGDFDSGSIAPGKTFSYTFNNGGSFGYHCSIHPMMSGTINVGSSAPAGDVGSSGASGSLIIVNGSGTSVSSSSGGVNVY